MAFFQSMQNISPAASAGIWLCPHESLDFAGARKLALYHPLDCKNWYEEDLCICSCQEFCNAIHHNLKTKATSLRTEIPIWGVHNVGDAVAVIQLLFRPDRAEQLLCSLDIPICSHLRTSDWQVATCYRGFNTFAKFDQKFLPGICLHGRSDALSPDAPHMAPYGPMSEMS
jgi:hypothetical protein